jgi:hypothetical protein
MTVDMQIEKRSRSKSRLVGKASFQFLGFDRALIPCRSCGNLVVSVLDWFLLVCQYLIFRSCSKHFHYLSKVQQ